MVNPGKIRTFAASIDEKNSIIMTLDRKLRSTNQKLLSMENKTTKRGINHGIELPNHAYHPNVSLRQTKRSGYIAWPEK